jgi:predicted porin
MTPLKFIPLELSMFSKKTAVAAATLLAAFAAQAQVNVYGNVDLFVGRVDLPGAPKGTMEVRSDVATGSFIGFKGQEDLGGGLKAFFKLESSISADVGGTAANATPAGNFWNRTSELGLAGGFGTVTLGNSLALGFLANNTFNPFSATGLASPSQYLLAHGPAWKDAVTYTSPNFSGFTVAGQWAPSEADGTDDDYGIQLNYGAGPLALGFTYSDEQSVSLSNVANSSGAGTRWQIGGSYDFGSAKLFAQYGQDKVNNVSTKDKFFQVGVAVPVTSSDAIVASFGQNKADARRVRDLTVAYDHSMSKRTGVYVAIKNVNDNKADPKSGTTFGVGIRHAF